ncbi:MAG: arylamine N-acetyltransferase, partial [Planctomycetota bacterium]
LDLYTVEPAAAHPADLALGNHWTSTHPESSFTRRPIIVRHRPTGRISLDGDRLVDRTGSEPVERTITTSADLEAVIREVMGIHLDAGPGDFERLLDAGRAASATGPHPGA